MLDENGNKLIVDREYMLLIIENLNLALELDCEYVDIGYYVSEDSVTTYKVERQYWEKLIDTVIAEGVDIEEFELCQELKDIKDII